MSETAAILEQNLVNGNLWVRDQWNAALWTSLRDDGAPSRWPTDFLQGLVFICCRLSPGSGSTRILLEDALGL
jgi:hypothetical protein